MSGAWLRGVNPLLKIGVTTLWLTAAVATRNPMALGLLAAGAALLALLAGAWRRPVPLLALVCGLAALGGIHLLIGGTPVQAAITVARLLVFAGSAGVLMLSTDPMDLLRALQGVPLPASLRLGVHLLWRSVGVLWRELGAIRFAARVDGEERALLRPARAFRYVILPLAFSMTSYADDLTLALQTRGVRLDALPVRTRFRLNVRPRDLGFVGFSIGFLGGAVLLSMFGG